MLNILKSSANDNSNNQKSDYNHTGEHIICPYCGTKHGTSKMVFKIKNFIRDMMNSIAGMVIGVVVTLVLVTMAVESEKAKDDNVKQPQTVTASQEDVHLSSWDVIDEEAEEEFIPPQKPKMKMEKQDIAEETSENNNEITIVKTVTNNQQQTQNQSNDNMADNVGNVVQGNFKFTSGNQCQSNIINQGQQNGQQFQ